MTTKGLCDAVRRRTVAAGQQGAGVTPRRYRAWYATHRYEGSGDLALVQEALGHVDPATTRRSVAVNGRRRRKAHARVFDQGAAGV